MLPTERVNSQYRGQTSLASAMREVDSQYRVIDITSLSDERSLHSIQGDRHSYYYYEKVGSARQRESDIYPISPKTPAPQYQPIGRKKRKGKRVEDYSRDSAAYANRKALDLLLKPASPTPSTEYGVSKIVPEGHREGNKSPAVLIGSASRRCISVPMCD